VAGCTEGAADDRSAVDFHAHQCCPDPDERSGKDTRQHLRLFWLSLADVNVANPVKRENQREHVERGCADRGRSLHEVQPIRNQRAIRRRVTSLRRKARGQSRRRLQTRFESWCERSEVDSALRPHGGTPLADPPN
jgi:hypothetical protein